jgi:hypothetical protein
MNSRQRRRLRRTYADEIAAVKVAARMGLKPYVSILRACTRAASNDWYDISEGPKPRNERLLDLRIAQHIHRARMLGTWPPKQNED